MAWLFPLKMYFLSCLQICDRLWYIIHNVLQLLFPVVNWLSFVQWFIMRWWALHLSQRNFELEFYPVKVNLRLGDICGIVCGVTQFRFYFLIVFLGVTNLRADQIQMTSLCAQWQMHHHATAYRVVIESVQGECHSSHQFLSSIRLLSFVQITVDDIHSTLDKSLLVKEALLCYGWSHMAA